VPSRDIRSSVDEDLSKLLSQFRVSSTDGAQNPLGAWAQWLVRLGFDLSQFHNNCRNFICISVPDRGFAAAFLSLGAVLGYAIKSFDESLDYENRLRQLKIGDLVSMPDGNGFLRSAKICEVGVDRISYFRHGESIRTTRFISHGKGIWPLMSGENLFAKSHQLIKTKFAPAYGNFLGARELIELRSSNEVILVGTKKLLVEELSDKTVSFEGENLVNFVKPFGVVGKADRCQSMIMPSVSDSIPSSLPLKQSFLMFDGAPGFMGLYDKFDALNTLIVLDRRSRRSYDAAVLVRQLRGQWINFGSPFRPKSVPPAIEFLSWSLEND